MKIDPVITGIGIVASNGNNCADFWESQQSGISAVCETTGFPTDRFSVNISAQIKDFDAKAVLGPKGLRNFDDNTLYLLAASKEAMADAAVVIDENNTDEHGVSVGTVFSHLAPIVCFDREMLEEGTDFANPALFPPTVINAASSFVSIRNNIQGFNTTITTGNTSGIEAISYALNAIRHGKVKAVLTGGVDSLSEAVFFSLYKLENMAGIKGDALSCPFDKRRNGPVLGEAAAMFYIEDAGRAASRGAKAYARILGIGSSFSLSGSGRINPNGLKNAIQKALEQARIKVADIDYISSSANSSRLLDKIEVKVLKDVFGDSLKGVPVSSIKSMVGETFGASGPLQIASVIDAMQSGVVPPTINYKEKDNDCDIDCVANVSRRKDIKLAMVITTGMDGYNSAVILERL